MIPIQNEIFERELSAYEEDIERLMGNETVDIISFLSSENSRIDFSTIATMYSNRIHTIVIGLCALVEHLLLETALEEEKRTTARKLKKRPNRADLIDFINECKGINLKKIVDFRNFDQVYEFRNRIIHDYGRVSNHKEHAKLLKAANILKLEANDYASLHTETEIKIRLTLPTLLKFFQIAERIIKDVKTSLI